MQLELFKKNKFAFVQDLMGGVRLYLCTLNVLNITDMICILMTYSRNSSSTGSSKNKNWQPKHQQSTNVNSNYSNIQ